MRRNVLAKHEFLAEKEKFITSIFRHDPQKPIKPNWIRNFDEFKRNAFENGRASFYSSSLPCTCQEFQ